MLYCVDVKHDLKGGSRSKDLLSMELWAAAKKKLLASVAGS